MEIIKQGKARGVYLIYAGQGIEEGLEEVTLYASGIVHIKAKYEVTTVHISMCEIVWESHAPVEPGKIRSLRVATPSDSGNTPPPAA